MLRSFGLAVFGALTALGVLGLAACANNPGVPRYATAAPPPLTPVGPQRDATTVRIEMKDLPWWTIADSKHSFVLAFDESEAPPTRGARVGPVRSRDITLDADIYSATRCAWEIVPMGEPRPCRGLDRLTAMEIARDAITEARAELRAKAADAGASVVGDVRCFAEHRPVADATPRLWCEGVALAADLAVAAPPSAIDPTSDPAAPIAHDPRTKPTRFVFLADASVGMLADKPVVASTLGIRYRPFELGFYILDLQRETLVPQDRGLVGLGLTALVRKSIGRSRADAIAGVSAIAAFENNSTNPDFDGLYHGFVGVAYQSPWRISGVAQPFAQLRAGAAYGTAIAAQTVPMVELHLGLSTPERR